MARLIAIVSSVKPSPAKNINSPLLGGFRKPTFGAKVTDVTKYVISAIGMCPIGVMERGSSSVGYLCKPVRTIDRRIADRRRVDSVCDFMCPMLEWQNWVDISCKRNFEDYQKIHE